LEEDKKYGGTAIFFGSLFIICQGLIFYYISFIKVLLENDQTYRAISAKPSVFEKLIYSYLSIYDNIFGKTPATPALAVAIPVSLILFITFLYYIVMYCKQKKRENLRTRLTEAENLFLEEQLKAEETQVKGEKSDDQSAV